MGKLKFIRESECDAQCSQALMGLARFREDAAFLEERMETLLEKYGEEWVAIYGRKVAGHDRDLARLTAQLQKKDLAPGKTVIRFLTRRKQLAIL